MDQDELLVILSNALARRSGRQKSLPILDQEIWPRLVGLVSRRFIETPAPTEADIEAALLEERENLLEATGLPPEVKRQLRQHLRHRVAEQWPALFALLHTHRYLLLKKHYRDLLDSGDAEGLLALMNETGAKGEQGALEYVTLAQNLLERGERSQALAAIRQGLNQYPNHPALSRELARHYQRGGFLKEAIQMLYESLEEFDDLYSRKILGSLLLSDGQIQGAADVWLDLVTIAPDMLDPLEVVQLATALEDASSPSAVWWEVLENALVPGTHEKVRGAFEQLLQEKRRPVAKS